MASSRDTEGKLLIEQPTVLQDLTDNLAPPFFSFLSITVLL